MHKAFKPGEAPSNYNYGEDCPECGETIGIVIDENDTTNYEVICPVCGNPMMLCTLCHWDNEEAENPHDCDWCPARGCYRKLLGRTYKEGENQV